MQKYNMAFRINSMNYFETTTDVFNLKESIIKIWCKTYFYWMATCFMQRLPKLKNIFHFICLTVLWKCLIYITFWSRILWGIHFSNFQSEKYTTKSYKLLKRQRLGKLKLFTPHCCNKAFIKAWGLVNSLLIMSTYS